jgi:L-gulonate 5-dehydrogenase
MIIGRQGVGFVSEVGENPRGIERGQRVAINARIVCGACYACKNNRPNDCENQKTLGTHLNGTLSDFALIPIRNLYPLPPHVKNEDALFVEPIAISIKIFADLNIPKGAHVAIFGATALGVAIAQVLLYHQAIPILLDSHQENLDYANDLGIYYTLNTKNVRATEQIRMLTGGRLCEYSVYLSASGEKPQDALDSAMNGGTVVFTGYSEIVYRTTVKSGSIFSKQLKVIGITNGYKHIEAAINLIAKHDIDVSKIPGEEISFEEVPAKMEEFAERQNFLNRLIVKF